MKTITITLTLPDDLDLEDYLVQINSFDSYNESVGVGSEHDSNSELIKGTLPKPRRPKTIN